MITISIFVVLAGMMLFIVREVVAQWSQGERRRVLYERAAGILDFMSDDIRLALTQEPRGVAEVKARFLGDYTVDDSGLRRQRLMFVRSFEAGPERAIVANAGDGRGNDMAVRPPPDPNAENLTPPAAAPEEAYTGLKVGDFKALGGMAAVAYFVKNQTLCRAIHAPVEGAMLDLIDDTKAQKLAGDVLDLQFEYWGQETVDWDVPLVRTRKEDYHGPQIIWDSTRGIEAPPLSGFFLHRFGSDTLNDPSDDVFPQKVRITLTVDSNYPRCLFTKLLDDIGEDTTNIVVDTTRGFADPEDPDPYILIDDEWMHYTKRKPDLFLVDKRGARGTAAKAHAHGAPIRQGQTFRRVVYLPGWREDHVPDNVFNERKKSQQQQQQAKRVLQ